MPSFYEPTGQLDLSATTLTDIYTAPVGYTAIVSVSFANRTAVAIAIRFSLAKAGAGDALGQYILYGVQLLANTTLMVEDISINQTDVLRVYASAAGVSVNVLVSKVGFLAT